MSGVSRYAVGSECRLLLDVKCNVRATLAANRSFRVERSLRNTAVQSEIYKTQHYTPCKTRFLGYEDRAMRG